MPTLHVPSIPAHQETGLLVPGFRPYLPSDALNTMLPMLPEIRCSALVDHTLNELHFDYSVSSPYDTTVQPRNPSSTKSDIDIDKKPLDGTLYGSCDPSKACGGINNCNSYDYYDVLLSTDFDSPMDDSPGEDFYVMYVRSPSPVEASF